MRDQDRGEAGPLDLGALLEKEQTAPRAAGLTPEQEFLIEEERANCMQGMLLWLSRDPRLAFILGVVFGVSSREGACILDTTPEAFRKQVSMGRSAIQAFMRKHCGLVNPANLCQSARLVPYDIAAGWIDPESPLYATRGKRTLLRRR